MDAGIGDLARATDAMVLGEAKDAPSDNGAADASRSTARRDQLLAIEARYQRIWLEEQLFEEDAPVSPFDGSPKYFVNFPYPYMNGLLHLGHAFTVTKADFAAYYQRLKGKRVLFPMAFHCTGMPIKACADKLKREIETYGVPPKFPMEDLEEDSKESNQGEKVEEGGDGAPAYRKKGKSKATAKKGVGKTQWEILQNSGLGLSDAELSKFADSHHWLEFFPPKARDDLKFFGAGIDWRRNFITTEANPYYDSFTKWHLRTLKNAGKVIKDKRVSIYSEVDGQPCADHDRASGEGVQPQEYVIIKMRVPNDDVPDKMKAAAEGRACFMAAATLRPETMYGQTNCWILPDGEYGLFAVNDNEAFICAEKAARNMAFQGLSPAFGMVRKLCSFKGQELIGLPVDSPCAPTRIYCLPLLTILMDKGTGVVTSVPSDAPDDWAALRDLQQKQKLREKYFVKDEWVCPFSVIPIIEIPELGDRCAVTLVDSLKIVSQNDKEKLAEAKKIAYREGFDHGVLIAGRFSGLPVKDAKSMVRDMLLESGEAVLYSEPAQEVISRSGDVCVCALTDQWYITYGEEEWKASAERAISKMNLFSADAKRAFEFTLGWLKAWACSRSFGLGTRLPWDEQFLVESLSDSTIYMAFYCVSHILMGGDMYGGSSNCIPAEHMTYEVYDYIFLGADVPAKVAEFEILRRCRQEFEYWYPFDLRVSGKDLIQNHLTFTVYNHTAIFPEEKWPLAFRTNGHLMLDSEKMSKSTGNFKTLRQAVEEYSADACRLSLADAGDGMEDANFETQSANASILRLTALLAFISEFVGKDRSEPLRSDSDVVVYADNLFDSEMNFYCAQTEKAFEENTYRIALQWGWFSMLSARDNYRLTCTNIGLAMRSDLVHKFVRTIVFLIAPFTPHYSEYVWRELLGHSHSIFKDKFPQLPFPKMNIIQSGQYVAGLIESWRSRIMKQMKPKKSKGKSGEETPVIPPQCAHVFTVETYVGWQAMALVVLQGLFDPATSSFPILPVVIEQLRSTELGAGLDDAAFQKERKVWMPFVSKKMKDAVAMGESALQLRAPFDEQQVVRENAEHICKMTGHISRLVVHSANASGLEGIDPLKVRDNAQPMSPTVVFL